MNIEFPLKTIASLLAVAALTAACNPFAPKTSAPQYPQDPRFAAFTVTAENKPVFGTIPTTSITECPT